MLITDAQIHLWDIDRPERPWPQPPRGRPQRPDGFSGVQALAAMDAIGVDRCVIVPSLVAGDSNEFAIEAVRAHPERFSIMGRLDISNPANAELLPTWTQQPGMLGIRLAGGLRPLAEQIADGSLEWLWAGCERHNVPIMMLPGPPALEAVGGVAERHPGLTIVLDHLSLRLVEDGTAFDTLDSTLALARFPKVHVKVSSVPNFSVEPYPYRDVHQPMRRVYDAYGPRRMFWGSDFTRLRGTYMDCLRLFRDELDFLSAEDREWILGKGIAECLGWPETPRKAYRPE